MMKNLYIFLLAFLGCRSLAAVDVSPFQHERLQFDVFYKGLNVADATMWIENVDSVTVLNWRVDTKSLAQLLFHVNNVYQVILDADGKMLQVKKSINQKNIRQEWTITYDWPAERAVSNQHVEWPVQYEASHLLCLLYQLRSVPLVVGKTLDYVLDIESQLWRVNGFASPFYEGNLSGTEIVFAFSPALEIVERAWKTDIITNRMGSYDSQLIIRFGPPPLQKPLLVQFGNENTLIEMRLTP